MMEWKGGQRAVRGFNLAYWRVEGRFAWSDVRRGKEDAARSLSASLGAFLPLRG